MDGMAGTGKTTILYSLCKWLKESDQLGGDFCCSRGSLPCRNVNSIIPTIAYRLAQYSPTFRSALGNILEKNPEAVTWDVRLQFQKLIQQPMQELKSTMLNGVVVAIDAPDKCNNNGQVLLFLQTLIKHAVGLPIKFLSPVSQTLYFETRCWSQNTPAFDPVCSIWTMLRSLLLKQTSKGISKRPFRLCPQFHHLLTYCTASGS